MDQLSLPYRIALVALLVVCALWFTVLKPTDPALEPATTAPGTTGLATSVNAAEGAAAASEASTAAKQAATGDAPAATANSKAAAGTAAPATPATKAAKPAKASKGVKAKAPAGDRSAPLLRALDRDRAVVLLFSSRRGIEDRAVRTAVAAVDRRNGRVVVKAVPVSQVGRYQAITRGARVLQAPTALVIAPGKRAKAIVGYTTTAEIDQAVGDALAAKSAKK